MKSEQSDLGLWQTESVQILSFSVCDREDPSLSTVEFGMRWTECSCVFVCVCVCSCSCVFVWNRAR